MSARDVSSSVISFRDVFFAYPGNEDYTLKGVSFDIRAGSTEVILGGSGSGKSTILKLILGLIKPDAGAILVEGRDIVPLSEEQLMDVRSSIGMVFQEGALFDSLSVAENVGFRLREHETLTEEAFEGRVAPLLGFVGLSEFYDRSPSDLSGGQRRRVAVARAMAHHPELILYDEPTTGLDPITGSTICDLIVKLRDLEGVTSVLVTHQLRDAFQVAQSFVMLEGEDISYNKVEDVELLYGAEFLVLNEGRLVFQGRQRDLFRSDEPYVQQFLEGQIPAFRR